MAELNLSLTVQQLIEKLDLISLESTSEEQKQSIASCRESLFQYFPQVQFNHKFKGRIEDILVRMNDKYSQRIFGLNDNFTILIDIYCADDYNLGFGDLHQLHDSMLLYFPHSSLQISILHSAAITEEELLIMVNFKLQNT